MSALALIETAKALVADDKGLLAMDESNPTCNQRFAALGIPQTHEARRAYRELIVTTPNLGECISGVILYDETIHEGKKEKVHVALDVGLNVILCVGETLEQRLAKQTTEVLEQQIILGLAAVSADSLPRLSIAYEPVWAIGNSGHHATPEQAEAEHVVIRKRLAQTFGKPADSMVIQYGGSVKPDNAAALLSQPNVDGALIGGASLKADQFLAIVQVGIKQTQADGKSI